MSYAAFPYSIPRRFRRALLFPPGLLALAWLLCLGCVGLIQTDKPKIHYSIIKALIVPRNRWCNPDSFIPPELAASQRNSPPCFTLGKLESFRPWYTFTFIGNTLPDYFTLQHIRIVSKQLTNDPYQERGFRVKFAYGATYSNLIQLLDWLDKIKLGKYWLDMDHVPTTLYSFTEKPKPPIIPSSKVATPPFICGNVGTLPPIPVRPEEPRYELPAILSPDWRNSLLLLLLLGLFSAWRLRRQWRRSAA